MLFRKSVLISAVFLLVFPSAFAQQVASEPRQEKLLNGLRVHMWSEPFSPKVVVKLRIHAGAAFDPQEKEGVMKLLSEAIFPNEAAREYFAEDLGGSLDIVCNYDYVEITASSKSEAYLTLLETLSNAVINPVLDKATTETVKSRLMAKLTADEKNAAYAADLAVRKRLLQTFPYGRPMFGSTSSVSRIDFADLRFAYDRLFGADNATLSISGSFPVDVGFRAVRRYFGAWLKSDKKAPSTFRQPDPPPAATQMIDSPETGVTEIRYALRGVARNDKEYAASCVLTEILQNRMKLKVPEERRQYVSVRNYANILPGIMIFGFSNIRREITAAVTNEKPKFEANDQIAAVLNEAVTAREFQTARSAAASEFDKVGVPTHWLDADTFRLVSVKADQALFDSVTLTDVQQYANRLKQQPIASVVLLSAATTN